MQFKQFFLLSQVILSCSIIAIKIDDNVADETKQDYSYKYLIADNQDSDVAGSQGHEESRHGSDIQGSYYVNLPFGQSALNVIYTANDFGYYPIVKYSAHDKNSHVNSHFSPHQNLLVVPYINNNDKNTVGTIDQTIPNLFTTNYYSDTGVKSFEGEPNLGITDTINDTNDDNDSSSTKINSNIKKLIQNTENLISSQDLQNINEAESNDNDVNNVVNCNDNQNNMNELSTSIVGREKFLADFIEKYYNDPITSPSNVNKTITKLYKVNDGEINDTISSSSNSKNELIAPPKIPVTFLAPIEVGLRLSHEDDKPFQQWLLNVNESVSENDFNNNIENQDQKTIVEIAKSINIKNFLITETDDDNPQQQDIQQFSDITKNPYFLRPIHVIPYTMLNNQAPAAHSGQQPINYQFIPYPFSVRQQAVQLIECICFVQKHKSNFNNQHLDEQFKKCFNIKPISKFVINQILTDCNKPPLPPPPPPLPPLTPSQSPPGHSLKYIPYIMNFIPIQIPKNNQDDPTTLPLFNSKPLDGRSIGSYALFPINKGTHQQQLPNSASIHSNHKILFIPPYNNRQSTNKHQTHLLSNSANFPKIQQNTNLQQSSTVLQPLYVKQNEPTDIPTELNTNQINESEKPLNLKTVPEQRVNVDINHTSKNVPIFIKNIHYAIPMVSLRHNKDDYLGPLPLLVNYWKSYGQSSDRSKFTREISNLKGLRLEYGFKPPLIPSQQIDLYGNPINGESDSSR